MKRILLSLSFIICHLSFSLAQSDDFGLDLSLAAQKKIDKKWSLGAEVELRTRDNTKTADRWSAGLTAAYKVAPWLRASAGYDLLYDNRDKSTYKSDGSLNKLAEFWGVRHRFNVSLTGQQRLGNLKLSLRERWQYTWRPEKTIQRWDVDNDSWESKTYNGKAKHVLRSRLQAELDTHSPLSPYASVELFNAWSLQKTRFTVGVDWDISKQHALGLFYRFQDVRNNDDGYDADRHIIGLGYKFKF